MFVSRWGDVEKRVIELVRKECWSCRCGARSAAHGSERELTRKGNVWCGRCFCEVGSARTGQRFDDNDEEVEKACSHWCVFCVDDAIARELINS